MDATLISDLNAVRALLKDPFARAEGAFREIGERLGTAVDLLGRLTGTFAGLPRELEHEDVDHATGHLAAVARAASAMADTLTDERLAFERLCAHNSDVSGRIARLRKTVGVINVLAINARIAASHIRAEEENFSVFTSEIGRLGKAATATIDRFAVDFERLATFVRSACAAQAEFEKRQQETLRSVARRLDASLSSVRAHRARAASAVAEIGDRSQEIARGIGAAVFALQIGDITRQRLEHVGHAIEVLAHGLGSDGDTADAAAAADAWSAALTPDQQRLAVGAVCRLQAAQTAGAATAFAREMRQVAGALDALTGDAQAIVRLGVDVYGTTDRANGSFLGALVADIRQADALIKECATARQAVDGVVASADATLTDLLGQVRAVQAIETDMRLVSLNTALKCGRLGAQGAALSVIAQELRTYANQTVGDACGVAEGLRAVVAAAAALRSQGESGGAGRITALEHETASSLARLEAVGNRLADAVEALGRDGARVGALLRETAAGTTAHDEVGRLMRDALARLTRVADAGGGAGDVAAIRDQVLELVRSRYTMASERDIHEMFADANAGPAALAGLSSGVKTELAPASVDDILF